MIREGRRPSSRLADATAGARRRPLLGADPRIAPTVPILWCTHGSPGDRCPRRARYADHMRQTICQQHAEERVRSGGLTVLLQDDRVRFLAESPGYAGGQPPVER
jgi:hypothetical protein